MLIRFIGGSCLGVMGLFLSSPGLTQTSPPVKLSTLAQAAPASPGATSPGQANQWQQFSPKDGRFSVQMPGKPKEEIERSTGPNPIELRMYSVDLLLSAYIVAYYDLPKAIPPGQERAFFNQARDRAVGGTNRGQVREQEIRLGQYPGRQIQFVDKDNILMQTRLYLVNRRVYTVIAAIPQNQIGTLKPTADRFLNSFKLL